jgi:hypothetical protein
MNSLKLIVVMLLIAIFITGCANRTLHINSLHVEYPIEGEIITEKETDQQVLKISHEELFELVKTADPLYGRRR